MYKTIDGTAFIEFDKANTELCEAVNDPSVVRIVLSVDIPGREIDTPEALRHLTKSNSSVVYWVKDNDS